MDDLRAALKLYFPDKTWRVEHLEWYPYFPAIKIETSNLPPLMRAGMILNENDWTNQPELVLREKIVPNLWQALRYPRHTLGCTTIYPPIIILESTFFSDTCLIGDSWGHVIICPFALASKLIRQYDELPGSKVPALEWLIPRTNGNRHLLRLTHYIAPGVADVWCSFDPMQRTWYKHVAEG